MQWWRPGCSDIEVIQSTVSSQTVITVSYINSTIVMLLNNSAATDAIHQAAKAERHRQDGIARTGQRLFQYLQLLFATHPGNLPAVQIWTPITVRFGSRTVQIHTTCFIASQTRTCNR